MVKEVELRRAPREGGLGRAEGQVDCSFRCGETRRISHQQDWVLSRGLGVGEDHEPNLLDNAERQKAHKNEASEKSVSHGFDHCRDKPFCEAWSAIATAALSSRQFLRPRLLLLVGPLRFLRLIIRDG